MKSKWLTIISGFVISVSLGCQDVANFVRGYDISEVEYALKPHIEFSPHMSSYHKEAILDAFYVLLGQDFQAQPGSYYERAFGDTTTSGLLQYLNDRIHYFVEDNELDLSVPADHSLEEMGAWEAFKDEFSRPAVTYGARNLGFSLWRRGIRERRTVHFLFGEKRVPVMSPRVGIVSMASSFAKGNVIYRISTLIHEARHSDCTGGPRRGSCGHLHTACPWDEDRRQCDNKPWGAYSMEMIYLDAVINSCENCSRTMRQQARRLRRHKSHFLLLEKDLFSGAYGYPDMSSSRH